MQRLWERLRRHGIVQVNRHGVIRLRGMGGMNGVALAGAASARHRDGAHRRRGAGILGRGRTAT